MKMAKSREKMRRMRLKRGFNMMGFLIGTSIGRIILGLIILLFGVLIIVLSPKNITTQILLNSGANAELISEYIKYINWTGIGFIILGTGVIIKGLLDAFKGTS